MKFDWTLLLAAAEWLAARTETTIDNMFIALVKAAMNDPVIGGWLKTKIEAGTTTEIGEGGTLHFVSDEAPAEITQALFDGKVFKSAKSLADVAATIKELAPYFVQLATLLKLFTGK